jgi:hypothetical protein
MPDRGSHSCGFRRTLVFEITVCADHGECESATMPQATSVIPSVNLRMQRASPIPRFVPSQSCLTSGGLSETLAEPEKLAVGQIEFIVNGIRAGDPLTEYAFLLAKLITGVYRGMRDGDERQRRIEAAENRMQIGDRWTHRLAPGFAGGFDGTRAAAAGRLRLLCSTHDRPL